MYDLVRFIAITMPCCEPLSAMNGSLTYVVIISHRLISNPAHAGLKYLERDQHADTLVHMCCSVHYVCTRGLPMAAIKAIAEDDCKPDA
jgi:hypothetical protein